MGNTSHISGLLHGKYGNENVAVIINKVTKYLESGHYGISKDNISVIDGSFSYGWGKPGIAINTDVKDVGMAIESIATIAKEIDVEGYAIIQSDLDKCLMVVLVENKVYVKYIASDISYSDELIANGFKETTFREIFKLCNPMVYYEDGEWLKWSIQVEVRVTVLMVVT